MALSTRFGPQPFTDPQPPQFYECGICDHYHPINWDGDCRDDTNRFAGDELDEKYTMDGWEEVPMLESDEKTLYDAGWMLTPEYGPRPSQWWREAREDDKPELIEACFFGGPPVIWAETIEAALVIDDL
jgi:hypothetical protein